MSKPKSVPVPEADVRRNNRNSDNGSGMQEPLSGSKKTKMQNHTPHHNPQG